MCFKWVRKFAFSYMPQKIFFSLHLECDTLYYSFYSVSISKINIFKNQSTLPKYSFSSNRATVPDSFPLFTTKTIDFCLYDVVKNKFHTHYSLFTKVWWTILQLAWLFFFVLYLYFMQYQGLFSLSIYAVPGLFGLTINAVPGLLGFPIQAVYLDCLDSQYKP